MNQIPPNTNIGEMLVRGELDATLLYLNNRNLMDRSTLDLDRVDVIKPLFNLNPSVGHGRGADEADLWLGASATRTACPGGASNNARGLKRQTCGRAAFHP